MTKQQYSQMLSERMDKRINDLLAVPRMYGSPEAVEMQFLQILEIQTEIENPQIYSRSVFDRYDNFIRQNFPTTAGPLSAILSNNFEQLTQKLQEFRMIFRNEMLDTEKHAIHKE